MHKGVNITDLAKKAMDGTLFGRRRRGITDCLSLSKLTNCINQYIADSLDDIQGQFGLTFNKVALTGGWLSEKKTIEIGAQIDITLDLVELIESLVRAVCSRALLWWVPPVRSVFPILLRFHAEAAYRT